MQRMSKKANLSKVYTCHCVRASAITTLFHAGVSAQQIISLTKHKNTNSLNHYINGLSTAQKGECSNILSSSLFSSSEQEVACNTSRPMPVNNDQPGSSAALQPNSWNIQPVPTNVQPIIPSGQSYLPPSHGGHQPTYYNCHFTVNNNNYTQQDSKKKQVSPCKNRKRLPIYSDDEE